MYEERAGKYVVALLTVLKYIETQLEEDLDLQYRLALLNIKKIIMKCLSESEE